MQSLPVRSRIALKKSIVTDSFSGAPKSNLKIESLYIYVLESVFVIGDVSGYVAPLLVGVADILKQAGVLFLVHKGSFAT